MSLNRTCTRSHAALLRISQVLCGREPLHNPHAVSLDLRIYMVDVCWTGMELGVQRMYTLH